MEETKKQQEVGSQKNWFKKHPIATACFLLFGYAFLVSSFTDSSNINSDAGIKSEEVAGASAADLAKIKDEAQKILGKLGTRAGGMKEVSASITQLSNIMNGNISDAAEVTELLDGAVRATNGQLSDVLGPIIDIFKILGITSKEEMIILIDSLMNASQMSSQSMSLIAINLKDFSTTASLINMPLEKVNEGVRMFGGMLKVMSLDEAAGLLKVFNEALIDPSATPKLAGMSMEAFRKIAINQGPAEAMSILSKRIASLSQ